MGHRKIENLYLQFLHEANSPKGEDQHVSVSDR